MLSLPEEILLEIIELLVPQTPTIGKTAAYFEIEDIPNWQGALKHEDNGWFQSLKSDPEKVFKPYEPLFALRRTGRYLGALCVPYLYHDLNCFDPKVSFGTVGEEYLRHVKVIRILVDESRFKNGIDALDRCKAATSLAFYFLPNGKLPVGYQDTIIDRFRSRRFESVGIYDTYDDDEGALIKNLAEASTPLEEIRILDHMVLYSRKNDIGKFHQNFSGITSLTVQGSMMIQNFAIPWPSANKLTHLHLVRYPNWLIEQIPFLELQYQYPCLRHLAISFLVLTFKWQQKPEPGHGTIKDAQCKESSRLTTLRIVDCPEKELRLMGVIPTTTLIIEGTAVHDIFQCFNGDDTLFPGMKTLRIAVDHRQSKGNWRASIQLRTYCDQRGVQLRYDAESYNHKHW